MCNGEKQICANDFYYNEFNTGNFIKNNCLQRCPLECQKDYMYNRQSFYKYPEESYVENTLKKNAMLLNLYKNETDFQYNLESNVAKVTIYYDSLSYTIVEEQPKFNWKTLLGTLGGHFHLFLGMSLMGVVEFIEIGVQFIFYLYYSKKNSTRQV